MSQLGDSQYRIDREGRILRRWAGKKWICIRQGISYYVALVCCLATVTVSHTWTNMTENREVYALESIHCEQRPFFQSPKAKDVMTVSGTMAGRHLLSVVLESFPVLLTC